MEISRMSKANWWWEVSVMRSQPVEVPETIGMPR